MMQKRIFIYLHTTASLQASWIILDNTNRIIQSVEYGDLQQLFLHTDCDVIAITPTEDILFTQVKLPKMSRQRLLQALPFALEEQLIDDITDLHFAIGEYQEDGTLPVAIVSRERMLAWLHIFNELKISPRAFVPDIFGLNFSEKTWTINTNNHLCIVRTGKYSGFACEKENLETLLQLKLSEETESNSINILRLHDTEIQLLEKLAHDFPTLSFINLLQGTFQAKLQSSQIRKVWLAACYLAIALIALVFIRDSISYLVLHHKLYKIETAINQIYHKNFPQAASVVAPRDRMTQKLNTLTGEISKNNFLGLLGSIGKSLAATHVRILNMDFREQHLTLDVSAASFDNLDSFIHALEQQGLAVKQQSAAEAGAEVKATLLIHAGII